MQVKTPKAIRDMDVPGKLSDAGHAIQDTVASGTEALEARRDQWMHNNGFRSDRFETEQKGSAMPWLLGTVVAAAAIGGVVWYLMGNQRKLRRHRIANRSDSMLQDIGAEARDTAKDVGDQVNDAAEQARQDLTGERAGRRDL